MTYDELRQIFLNSTRDDWTDNFENPTFLYGQPNDDGETDGHYERRVYKADIAIGLAHGYTVNDEYVWDFIERFPDKRPARSLFIDVLYHGQPVIRELGVSVDGGRATLPSPSGHERDDPNDPGEWVVDPDEHAFLRAFAGITDSLRNFDSYFKMSGMKLA